MKTFTITGLGKNFTVILDDEDFEYVNKYNWHITQNNNRLKKSYYAKRWEAVPGYIMTEKKRGVYLHQEIYKRHFGEIPYGMIIDHKDTDSMNNQSSNLRLSTRKQNRFNSCRPVTSKSRFKGVTFIDGKYTVQIAKDDRKYHIGRFDDEILAAKVYNAVAPIFHGEYAKLNQLD
jgi:hypothetical protein